MFTELAEVMGCATTRAMCERFDLKSLDLKAPRSRAQKDIKVLSDSVNPVRLKNNPVDCIDKIDRNALQRNTILGENMKVEKFLEIIGADFYAGVPDSQLKALCDYLMNTYGIDKKHHIIAANEGNCVALAAGYHLATGKTPVVYMQNSGEGNIINPLASLLNDKVYAIPMIFIIGWRGEPGVHDEPQHIYQGEVTVKLMEDMDVKTFVIGKDTAEDELKAAMEEFKTVLVRGQAGRLCYT